MVLNIASFILKFISLGLVIAAGGLWASADVDIRPKTRDEQTLIGGAIWSQTQIPIGILISMIVDENIYVFFHAYLLFAGFLILTATGVMLITSESVKLKRNRSIVTISNVNIHNTRRRTFDKTYFIIGVLLQIAAVLTLADLIVTLIHIIITGLLAFGAYWTTKYIMNSPEANLLAMHNNDTTSMPFSKMLKS